MKEKAPPNGQPVTQAAKIGTSQDEEPQGELATVRRVQTGTARRSLDITAMTEQRLTGENEAG